MASASVGCQVLDGKDLTTPPTPTSPSTFMTPSLEPYDEVLSNEAVPAPEIVVLVGNTAGATDAESICEALGLDRGFVAVLTEVRETDLAPKSHADSSALRCAWQAPATTADADGDGDGKADLVFASVGLMSVDERADASRVGVEWVATTPDGLDVTLEQMTSTTYPNIDPGPLAAVYELEEFGAEAFTTSSVQLDDPDEVALVALDQVLSTIGGGMGSL